MQTIEHGLRGMGLLLDLNRDRLVFPLAVALSLVLAALVGAELMHPTIPVEPFHP
jgi:hypothetical protein